MLRLLLPRLWWCSTPAAMRSCEHADVVFPVAAAPEKAGTFLNWEGRPTAVRPGAAHYGPAV